MIELRHLQVEPVKKGIEFFKNKKPVPSIIVAPTAFGKSIAIAAIAKQVEENLLILQPSKELLEQNFSKFSLLGGSATIYSASFNTKVISRITYATIGSIKSIGKRFKELGFTKMIIDECHLYPRNMDSMLGTFLKDSQITHVLGLTATPIKLQNNSDINGNTFSKLVMLTSRSKHGNFFKEIIHVCQISEMVKNKYWAKLHYEEYVLDEGKLVFNSTKADFTEDSLKKVYESNDIHNKIITKVADLADRKSILVFVPSVQQAIDLAHLIPNSYAVYGDMDAKERDFVIKGFKNLSIRVIINVNVLSVGFDHPELDCIICARPTASLSWLYQAYGRGTRIHPNKEDCLIVDFSGNTKRFGKIEYFKIVKERIWKIYGEGGRLLTGIPMHEIGHHSIESEKEVEQERVQKEKEPYKMPFGKHKGEVIEKIPQSYISWMLSTFDWNDNNKKLKTELLKASSVLSSKD
jgi:DNA repair protein RadD